MVLGRAGISWNATEMVMLGKGKWSPAPSGKGHSGAGSLAGSTTGLCSIKQTMKWSQMSSLSLTVTIFHDITHTASILSTLPGGCLDWDSPAPSTTITECFQECLSVCLSPILARLGSVFGGFSRISAWAWPQPAHPRGQGKAVIITMGMDTTQISDVLHREEWHHWNKWE